MESQKKNKNNGEPLILTHNIEDVMRYMECVRDSAARVGDPDAISYVDDISKIVAVVAKATRREAEGSEVDKRFVMTMMMGPNAGLPS